MNLRPGRTYVPKSPPTLRLTALVSRMFRSFRCLALGQGLWNSMRRQAAVNSVGDPIPWYTYACIEYLRCFNFSDCDVFEFGAGNSSLFWAGLARNVTSVENDPDWYAQILGKALPNQQVMLCQQEYEYVAALASSRQSFHVIVVDGKWRKSCVEEAILHIADGGMILLDNSDWHPLTCSLLRERGFFQIDFSGPGPINEYCWTTSIFVRASCTLQKRFKDPLPIGGIRQSAD
jgi:hypothetical protein